MSFSPSFELSPSAPQASAQAPGGIPYRQRWEDASAGFVLARQAGDIIDANRRACELSGHTRAELCGLTLQALCPTLTSVLGALDVGEERQLSARIHRCDGGQLGVKVALRRLTPDVVQVALSDAASEGRVETALRDRVEALEAVSRISTLLHQALSEAEVVERTIEAMKAFADSPSAVVYTVDAHGALRLAGASGRGLAALVADTPPPHAHSLAGLTARTGQLQVAVDAATDERIHADVRAAMGAAGFRGALTLPVRFEDETLGVISLLYTEAPRLTSVKREALLAIARTVGLALTNARHLARLEREVVERERAERALRQSRARYQAITAALPDLIFRISREGRYTFVAAHDPGLLALPAESLLGRSLRDGIGATLAAKWQATIEAALEAGALRRIEYELVTQDGRAHVFEGRIVPIPEDDEVQVIVRDVTERAHYERTLVEAKERAEEMGRLKASFLANMSHEVRTPLTAILGLVDVLAPELAGEPRELLDLVRASARRLTDTLNSVLDLAQIEAGAVRLRRERADLAALVRETVATFSHEAQVRGLTLDCRVGDEPVEAAVDPAAVARIAINLLSNALKFTETGSITVMLRTTAAVAELTVADTGMGIAQAFLPHVFDEFRQASEGIRRSHQGAGIGLTITKHLVEHMGGQIHVESEVGRGTTFRVVLPRGGSDG